MRVECFIVSRSIVGGHDRDPVVRGHVDSAAIGWDSDAAGNVVDSELASTWSWMETSFWSCHTSENASRSPVRLLQLQEVRMLVCTLDSNLAGAFGQLCVGCV